jgi:hypothetical protein
MVLTAVDRWFLRALKEIGNVYLWAELFYRWLAKHHWV